jgi:integrase
VVRIAFNYVVKGGRKLRKDTKTHQDRYIAIDPVTCALIQETLDDVTAALAEVGVTILASAYLFSNDPAHARLWNPDWVTHRMGDLARAAGANLDIKRIRHYTASQMLTEGFDLGNTAARLGHSGGRDDAETLRRPGI